MCAGASWFQGFDVRDVVLFVCRENKEISMSEFNILFAVLLKKGLTQLCQRYGRYRVTCLLEDDYPKGEDEPTCPRSTYGMAGS